MIEGTCAMPIVAPINTWAISMEEKLDLDVPNDISTFSVSNKNLCESGIDLICRLTTRPLSG